MTPFSRRQLLFQLACLSGSLACYGHPGHGPHTHEIEIDAEEAKLLARDAVEGKIKEGKLHSSWSKIPPNQPQPIQLGGRIEWLVHFDDPGRTDPKQRRLYVFLKLNGQLSGINFTGR
ncbi:MAG: DUF6488 family protein [Vulcanimicrobiota bacterium]